MPSILNLAPHAVAQPQDTVLSGILAPMLPAPTSFDSPLYVVIPGWQPDQYIEVTRWSACHGAALPRPGCEVHLEKNGDGHWIATWWAGTQAPAITAPYCNKLTNYLLA